MLDYRLPLLPPQCSESAQTQRAVQSRPVSKCSPGRRPGPPSGLGWHALLRAPDRRLATLAVAVCWLLSLTSGASAELIVAYDGANSTDSLPASEFDPSITTLDLLRGSGLNSGSGSTYNSSGWTDEATDYLQWGWSSSPPINLTDLDLRYDRSGSGPTGLDIQLAVNGGAYQSIFVDADVMEAGEEALDIDLSGFLNVTSASFRLFGTGASSGTGTFDIEPLGGVTPDRGIVVNGVVVPEPSSVGLLLTGIPLALIARRRRFRSADRSHARS